MGLRAAILAGLAGRDFSSSSEQHYAPDEGLEPVHLELDLHVDLDGRSAAGSVTHTVAAKVRGRRRLVLDAVELDLSQVEDLDGHALEWSYDGAQLEVVWSEAPDLDEQRRLKVSYSVKEPLTGMSFSLPDEAYPTRARFMATDHETERARYWLPCVDHPSVRTTLDLRLRAAQGLTILANGAEQERETHADGTHSVRWRLEQRCPSYLICLAVGEFVRCDAGEFEGRPVAYFAPAPYTAEDLERSFGRTPDMLAWMTKKLGAEFPFPKYYQLAVPLIGGAMENISLVTWDDAFVLDERLKSEWGDLVDRVNVHEMAHSYFGDAIVCRDFAHAWLKESWATYVEALWVEDTQGADELAYHMHVEARDYMRESDSRYARPIVTRKFDSSWDMFDQHLYPGGAWRLHMLRAKLGDEAFFAAVQDYVREFSGALVETDDFRRALERRSGLSLARFFDEWLRSPGYPQLKLSQSWDGERNKLELSLEQTQVDKKQGIGRFSGELELALELADGSWRRETIPLAAEQGRTLLVLRLEDKPRQIVADPDTRLLHTLEFDPGHEQLTRSVSATTCPYVSGRLHAAQTLAKSGKAKAVAALATALEQEPLWGVRAAAAEALAEAGTPAAISALAALLAREQDPRALKLVAGAAGDVRDPELAAGLRALLQRSELGYQARAAALGSLGAQRGESCDPGDHELLAGALEAKSWWSWVARGAYAGLGASRSAAASELLLRRLPYGVEAPQARPAAISALAEAARWQEVGLREQAAEAIGDLARDPVYRVRTTAAAALASLGEAAGGPALEVLERQVAGQDVASIRRAQRTLRSRRRGGQPDAKLTKQVEELTDTIKKLERRLAKLEANGADSNNGAK